MVEAQTRLMVMSRTPDIKGFKEARAEAENAKLAYGLAQNQIEQHQREEHPLAG